MSEHTLERQLEWEPASEPIVLEPDPLPPPFIAGTRKMTVTRDDEFCLSLLAEGVFANKEDLRARYLSHSSAPAGTHVKPDHVDFETPGAHYHLEAFLQHVPNATFAKDQIRFRQRSSVRSIRRSWTRKVAVGDDDLPRFEALGPLAWRTDWFLNGPHDPVFTQFTKRRRNVSFTRQREIGGVTDSGLPTGNEVRDHFVVAAGSIRFAVCQVPEELAPKWLHALGVDFGLPIPDENTRQAVEEILSFVFGRRMLRLGSTSYDLSGSAIEEEMVNPVCSGLRTLCSGPDLAPLPTRFASSACEDALSTLVPTYLSLRSPLALRNALWAYWAAREAPPPINLALFRAAVESLKTGWFASLKSKSKGVYLPQDEYLRVAKDFLEAIDQNIGDANAAAAIANKIRGAYQMGSNEQVRTFFNEIGLKIGSNEKEAMKAANAPAHGNLSADKNFSDAVRHAWAYRALFERIFLRLLRYGGKYVDRTTLGWPERPIEEPAGQVRG